MGAQMILGNAYHLHLRPGDEVIRDFGGLHAFMGWDGPILTDSGGFQVFSLEGLRTVCEDGVEFRSHIDGSQHVFTPESVMQIERNLGADVIMQFDHVIPGQSDEATARDASERSLRWLARCAAEVARWDASESSPRQALFPIVQGGIHESLRRAAARAIRDSGDWLGFGIGGLSVGEAKPDMYRILEVVDGELPRDRPRYLMGVGFPEDLVEGVRRGVDLFDCVAPTRMGRNGAAFTRDGRLNIKRAEFRTDQAAARRGVRLLGVPPILARVHPASLHRRRDPRPSPAFPAQCTFPRSSHARRARRDPRRDDRRVEPRLARALPLSTGTYGMTTLDLPLALAVIQARRRRLAPARDRSSSRLFVGDLLLHHHAPAAETAAEARDLAQVAQEAATRSSRPAASSAK